MNDEFERRGQEEGGVWTDVERVYQCAVLIYWQYAKSMRRVIQLRN
jgi:hypothetical protein